MGERKVLNRYYPNDFDPAKIPKRRQGRNQQIKVRMMLPMTLRCNTCGHFVYRGTKFNSRKEDAAGDKYLGCIQVLRFYFKCTKCSAEITIKTDPHNSDYVVESGATRNFEPWRARDAEDAIESLESKALDSKREMDIVSTLEHVKSLKSKHATLTLNDMLAALQRPKEDKLEQEDEALIKSTFKPKILQRIHDEDFISTQNFKRRKQTHRLNNRAGELDKFFLNSPSPQVFAVKKASNTTAVTSNALQFLSHHYDSDQDD